MKRYETTQASAHGVDQGRRKALGTLGAGLAFGLPGCCSLRSFPKPQIGEPDPAKMGPAFLAPGPVNKSLSRGIFCVDAHAHFFNASDVTVKGYLEGPVAHSAGGDQGRLLRLLAPLADALAGLAPTAKAEYDHLDHLSSRTRSMSAAQTEQMLDEETARHRQEQSMKFYQLLKTRHGRPFAQEYERIQEEKQRKGVRAEALPIVRLDEQSLMEAMELGEVPGSARRNKEMLPMARGAYAEGTLAFVGYMLSYRWANLRTYRKALSTHGEAVGVDRVLGSLVDFDRWLDCPPRSAHEDQIRLQARLSELSEGYLRPLVSYNPWTDIVENGKSLKLVEEAVTKYGFVGAKIYPANGFRPWGNTKAQDGPGLPPHEKINRALEAFWNKCFELNIPVMAHAGRSMGKDDDHDALGGPEGWAALVAAYAATGRAPLVNLGHFGGDTEADDWTSQMATLMARPHADKVFGDLGYWSELQCDVVGSARCETALQRLRRVLNLDLRNHERVADRVMFGSDWLMLSREPSWSDYASGLFRTIGGVAPEDLEKIFGKNAVKCFGSRIERI
jgi:predicted TIM-barrel fold metal-dependent hydrolase